MIELTLKNDQKVLVNLDRVTDIAMDNHGIATISYSEEYYFSVKETYEEVKKLVDNRYVTSICLDLPSLGLTNG